MARYVCPICGYVHDDAAGVAFDTLPDTWTCPVCGAAKSEFEAEPKTPTEAKKDAVAGVPADDAAVAPSPPTGVIGQARLGHRIFGYVFLAIYLILVIQMAPRLWTYQIEFPARTVVHLSLGMAVGVMLLLKIGIVRFFRKLDQALVPLLGTSLLVCSVVLIGISVPWAFREAYATARLFTADSQQRVRGLLTQAGLGELESAHYSTPGSLRKGQRILRQECVGCHDLRTVLAKPRTPVSWRQTVQRMADRTTTLDSLDEEGQWQVTAYLTAISPQLQISSQLLRAQQGVRDESRQAAAAITAQAGDTAVYDAAQARTLVAAKCSQCHEASLVAESPPQSAEAARALVAAMVEEGLDATESELSLIVEYLKRTYVK